VGGGTPPAPPGLIIIFIFFHYTRRTQIHLKLQPGSKINIDAAKVWNYDLGTYKILKYSNKESQNA